MLVPAVVDEVVAQAVKIPVVVELPDVPVVVVAATPVVHTGLPVHLPHSRRRGYVIHDVRCQRRVRP